jgi:hypothetical protein
MFFVQHDSTEAEINCLKVCAEWHRAYAKRHAMEYIEDYTTVSAAPFSANSEGQVWLFGLVKSLPLNAMVLYVDADALVIKPEVNVFLAVNKPDFEFMLLGGKHLVGVNSGVIILKNTRQLQDWFARIMATGPVIERKYGLSGNTLIDHKFLIEFVEQCPVKFGFLDDRFNWFAEYLRSKRSVLWDEKDAIIKAWHGIEPKKRVSLLRNELHKLSGIAA